jgi:two-component system CheB/CheR fusion protein
VKRAKGTTKRVAEPVKKTSALPPGPEPSKADSFPIVGIGASAGGLEAFKELLAALPENAGMAYVLIPHLDPESSKRLKGNPFPLHENSHRGSHGRHAAERDRIYVIPPNKTMGISAERFVLVERDATHRPHLPIDYFFRRWRPTSAIAPLESCSRARPRMGRRAASPSRWPEGSPSRRMRKTAKYYDMPENAIRGGSIDFMLPPKDIARNWLGFAAAPTGQIPAESLDPDVTGPPAELERLFALAAESGGSGFPALQANHAAAAHQTPHGPASLLKMRDYLSLH